MILRRIIDHVKSQNWTAVALDFAIVVVGVFIGIQVSNWNAARAEKVAVRQHLSEIMDDIAADVAHFDEQIRATTWRVAAIRRLLGENDYMFEHAAIAGEPSLPKKTPEVTIADLDTLLARANVVRSFQGHRSGFDSLLSAGRLRLITDRTLARDIQRYYADYANLEYQQANFTNIRNAGLGIVYRHGYSAFGLAPFDSVSASVASDPEFIAYLQTSGEVAEIHTNMAVQYAANGRALLTRIEAALKTEQ